ncbi:MAG: DNA cytosine methyltransferase [Phycisphaerae bacterium]|jgi:DNA (cytosine-5)-methyltransferase 1
MLNRTMLVKNVRNAVSSMNGQAKHLGISASAMAAADLAAAAERAGRLLAMGEPAAAAPAVNPESARIDVVDVFCGCGGISAGFRLFNTLLPLYRLAGAMDLNEDANETYAANLGIRPLREDAHEIVTSKATWTRFCEGLDRRSGNLTIVAGGPPCQGFTSHKKTIDGCDELNNLYPDFARIGTRLDADVILMENVPELLTERSWPFYVRARDIMRQAGYIVRTRIYNFADFGLPQERFRAVTLAMRKPFAMPEPIICDRKRHRTVRQALGDLPPLVPGDAYPGDMEHVTARHRASTVATISAVPRDGGRRPENVGPACLRRLAARNGRSGFDDVYGRLWWDRPSVTITGSSRNPASGRFVHPEQNRGLSVREASLLQGFPRTYRFAGSFDSRFLQVGNAVAPTVAAHLAGHILAELLVNRRDLPEQQRDIEAPLGTSFSRLIAGIKKGTIRL